jgi:hypothetical protein
MKRIASEPKGLAIPIEVRSLIVHRSSHNHNAWQPNQCSSVCSFTARGGAITETSKPVEGKIRIRFSDSSVHGIRFYMIMIYLRARTQRRVPLRGTPAIGRSWARSHATSKADARDPAG